MRGLLSPVSRLLISEMEVLETVPTIYLLAVTALESLRLLPPHLD